jgi:nitronate monooxygenase
MKTRITEMFGIEREKGAALTIDDIHEQVAGIYPKVMTEGDMQAGAWRCGMVAGLIHDVPTCRVLIDRIMREAEEIVGRRLVGFVQGRVPA